MTTADDFVHMRPFTDTSAPARPRASALAQFPDVLEAATHGESWAFERLYHELAGPLRGFARNRGVRDPEALVDDVLVEVFRSLPQFSGDESAFRGFAFHVARRRVIDDYRRQGRRPAERPLSDAPEGAISARDDMPHELPGVALDGTLALLDTLTSDQRDVLILRVVCDLSIAETATALDKPITAIKALQRRGISALRRTISAQGVSS